VVVFSNLKKRKLGGIPSDGMVLCAFTDDDSKVLLIEPPEGAANGERCTFEGYEGDAATGNQIDKKKMLQALMPDLKTDGEGNVTWKGIVMMVGGGAVGGGGWGGGQAGEGEEGNYGGE